MCDMHARFNGAGRCTSANAMLVFLAMRVVMGDTRETLVRSAVEQCRYLDILCGLYRSSNYDGCTLLSAVEFR